jgi:hypothetical protein
VRFKTFALLGVLTFSSYSFGSLEPTQQETGVSESIGKKHTILHDLSGNDSCVDVPIQGLHLPTCSKHQLETIKFLADRSIPPDTKTAFLGPLIGYYLVCSVTNAATYGAWNSSYSSGGWQGKMNDMYLKAMVGLPGGIASMTVCLPVTGVNYAIYRLVESIRDYNRSVAVQNSVSDGIVKDASGKANYMTRVEAVQYCERQGKHLPSARELAQLAMSMGAKGFVDYCSSADPKCSEIHAINADGHHDSFRFDWVGYKSPKGDLGDKVFWSSSVQSTALNFAFLFNGRDGSLDYMGFHSPWDTYAFSCVPGR